MGGVQFYDFFSRILNIENLHLQRSMWAVGRSRLLLFLLLPIDNEAMDGCPGLDYWRCGNGDKEGGNGTKSIPVQCIEQSKLGDGKENNCLDRSDEDPFQEAANETIIDFRSLKNCTDEHGQPGLECSNQFENSLCIRTDDFCKDETSEECPVLGEGIRTNDPTLCANISLWEKLTCGKTKLFGPSFPWQGYLLWGEDRVRCQGGKSGQCVDKEYWGILGGETNYRGKPSGAQRAKRSRDLSALERLAIRLGPWASKQPKFWKKGKEEEFGCKDGSDLYRPIKRPTEAEEPDRQPSRAGWAN